MTMVFSFGSLLRMAALLWMCLLPGGTASSSSAPWQSNPGTSVLEQEEYRDMGPTVFSPGGRLHSVERTVAAASSLRDASSNLVIALTCRDGVVLVTTCNTSPHLDITTTSSSSSSVDNNDEDETETETAPLWVTRKGRHAVPPISRVAPKVFMVTGGNAVDSSILREKITRMAEATRQENDGGTPLVAASSVSCSGLARRVSDHLQSPTQTIGKAGRVLASCAVLVGRDDDRSPCLWRIDPTGQFWKCDATAIGRGSHSAEAHLMDVLTEKDVTDFSLFFSNVSTRLALSIARECIQKTLPKEPTSHWQALLLRTDGERIITQVLHGSEIHSLLNSTPEPDTTNGDESA